MAQNSRTAGMRRGALALLAVVFIVSGLVRDMREAQANPVFLPLIIGIQFIGLMGVGAAIEMWDGAPTPAASVGVQALSVTINDPAAVQTAGNSAAGGSGAVRVPTTTLASSAASVPAPSGAPATMAFGPTVRYYCFSSTYIDGQCAQTYDAECQIMATTYGGTAPSVVAPSCYYTGGSPASPRTMYSVDFKCQPGYSQGASNCTLQNAYAANPDSKADLTRSGTTLAKVSGDDSGGVKPVISTKTASNDTVDVSGMSATGQPRNVRVTATSGGGSDITQSTQKTDGAGVTYIEKRTYTVDNTGTVTAAGTSAVQGQLAATGTGTTAKYTESGAGTAYTPVPVSSSGSSPTDYAKAGEAAAAAASIKAGVKIDETGSTGGYVPPATSTYATDLAAAKTAIEGLQSPDITIGSWWPSLVPGVAVACHGFDFRAKWGTLDSTTTLDICEYLEIVRQILGYLFGVGSVVYIWRRFANARGTV